MNDSILDLHLNAGTGVQLQRYPEETGRALRTQHRLQKHEELVENWALARQ